MTQPAQYTAERLETIRRTKNRSGQIAWAAGLLTLWLAVLLALALIDYRTLLPVAVRDAGAIVLAAILIATGIRFWQLSRRGGDAKHVALELESHRPDLGCVVSTASEYLDGGRKAARDYEPELVEALQEQAARKLRTVELPWYRRKVAAAVGVFSVALGALGLFMVLNPSAGTAIVRVTAPWANAAYTRIEVQPGNAEVAVGRSLGVLATFRGRPPTDARLLWRTGPAESWQTAPLAVSAHGIGSNSIASIAGPLTYKVAAGDAVSPEFSVRTFVPPEIKRLATTTEFPSYTGHAPVEQTSPDVQMVRGSRLAFHLAASGDIASAKLYVTNQPPIDLTRDANGQWSTSLAPRTNFDYRVELTDNAGHKASNENPYHVVVVPDEPPKIDIVDPGADVRADPTERVPLRITASDDFSVKSMKLVFRKLGEPEQAIVCAPTNLNHPEAFTLAHIDLAPLHLQPYELVEYHAEASDNNTLDGPGLGKSPVYFIEVTTNSEPMADSHGNSQKINLLQLEKQIIAATTAVPEGMAHEKFPKVAEVQRQTKEYAETFRDSSPLLAAAPPEARTEFEAAITSMGGAIIALDKTQRATARVAEEDALRHMYQAVKLFPDLKSGMCNCTGIKIVAEAIKKKKMADEKKHEQELPKVIAQAKKVAAAQAQLNGLYRKSAEESPADAPKKGDKPGENGQPKPSSDGKPSPGQNGTDGKPDDNSQKPGDAPSDEQKRLAAQASDLAAKLRALAATDPRVSSRHSQHMSDVSAEMRKAGEFVADNHIQEANEAAHVAYGQIEEIIGALEVLANNSPQMTDAAAEDYPKEYGQKISDYLRALSYQK